MNEGIVVNYNPFILEKDMVIDNVYTSKNGKFLVLNPNEKLVNVIRNRIKLRNGYCPCRVEESEDTLCPCKEMREEGKCCCKLFVEES